MTETQKQGLDLVRVFKVHQNSATVLRCMMAQAASLEALAMNEPDDATRAQHNLELQRTNEFLQEAINRSNAADGEFVAKLHVFIANALGEKTP